MREIELFYKIVESEIRRRHIKYLKRRKVVSMELDEPENGDASDMTENEKEKLENVKAEKESRFANIFGGDTPLNVRRFNKGIDTALRVLAHEFKRFEERLKKEDSDGGLI